jgi:primosomal protein N' (replication factor Y)
VPDLAAAIVVDDADEALQEERVPTWHARDVLAERAKHVQFTVVSPVPTVEAIALVDAVDAPSHDVEVLGWPRVAVVDRREEPPGARLMTEPLAAALRDARGLAVCVVNRRGRFRLLACDVCHELERWDHGEQRPLVCATCGATKMRVLRAGVTRLREELEALVPDRRVVDVDKETGAVPEADVLIGTESVLHRAEVRRRRPVLVAYLDFDQELLAPRYRAATQALWLATRGAQLLAGRPRGETRLLVQTRMPAHEVVRALATATPTRVTDAETERRRALAYPPFGGLAEVSGDASAVAAATDALRTAGATVLGPSGGKALVSAPSVDDLADLAAEFLPAARAIGRLRWVVDPPRV